jgi:hypothetical protein
VVHGFISLEVAGGFTIPIDLDASFHWLINLFIAGLSRPTVCKSFDSVAANFYKYLT